MITAKGLEKLGFVDQTDFILRDDSDSKGVFIHEWLSESPQPSGSDIDAASKVAEAEYDAKKYQRDREYPPIGDQLDEIYHKGIDEWKKTIKKVKDAHPKP